MSGASRGADQEIFDTFSTYMLDHEDAAVRGFSDNLRAWGTEWAGVEPKHGVASDMLAGLLDRIHEPARPVVELFVEHRATRFWEQSYTKQDGYVGDDMLASYGFAEIVGQRGPFVSDCIRGGLGLYGPHITYPAHRHRPDEVYLPVSGTATYLFGPEDDRTWEPHGPGDVVHVESMTTHGFVTDDAPFVVLYLWQDGNLRETSRFD